MTTEAMVSEFRTVLAVEGLYAALGVLNRSSDFRFTGVYRFEDDVVVNVTLFDRQNPTLRIGEDVRLIESYCRFAADAGDIFVIEDSGSDSRLMGHAARDAVLSYGAVLLSNPDGSALGTLCHFDVKPRRVPAAALALLEAVKGDVAAAVASRTGLPHRDPRERRLADFATAQPPAAPA